MSIFELFSKRIKKEEKKEKDVYQYDDIPKQFRVQVCHILKDGLGNHKDAWKVIHDIMCRELGIFVLHEDGFGPREKCINYILDSDTLNLLDIIEVSFTVIENLHARTSSHELRNYNIKQQEEDLIKELNYRFKEHSIGYEYINNEIVRVDRKYVHKNLVKPALKLLYDADFKGANDEFLKAHKHYRNKNFKESIAEALKAFESTIKTICDEMGYAYNKDKDTSSKLISILITNDFIPNYLTSHFNSLRSTLESELPTVRNKTSGHGQGSNQINIPDYFASYSINLCASNIVFLVDIYKEKNS